MIFKICSILVIVIFLVVIIGFVFIFVSSYSGAWLYISKWSKFLKILNVISRFVTLWEDNSILSTCSSLNILSSDAHVSETGLRMPLLLRKLKIKRNCELTGM